MTITLYMDVHVHRAITTETITNRVLVLEQFINPAWLRLLLYSRSELNEFLGFNSELSEISQHTF